MISSHFGKILRIQGVLARVAAIGDPFPSQQQQILAHVRKNHSLYREWWASDPTVSDAHPIFRTIGIWRRKRKMHRSKAPQH